MLHTILKFIVGVMIGFGAFVFFVWFYGWMYLDVEPYLQERRQIRQRKREEKRKG